ncbi:winged helix-turn-helix domain-containing protein [Leifsonia bigeumensis]|uniref:Winged helix-turn-helix domain-containing protein n=1 Tax=Leifsonella bigeumensis TaxID=433643 RepID=A0ABP7FNU3_9MICO
MKQLTLLQVDPTAAIAPNADLVAWSRLGAVYRPEDLTRALEVDRTLFEFDALIRPMEDLPLFLAGMQGAPHRERTREWLTANRSFHRDVLARLRDAGPLASRDLPDTAAVPWASSGWTNNRNTTQLLEILAMRGEIAISHRKGRERFWDLAERVYPADAVAIPFADAVRIRDERRLAALGIARAKAPEQPIEPVHVGEAGEEATVEGVPGTWRVDPAALEAAGSERFEGRTALLSPFDRLGYDRVRARQLFGFEYTLEMYKPEAKRQWGYFALPVLHDDELVGKVDAKADRKAGILTVHAIHEDAPFDADTKDAVHGELDGLAEWLGLERVGP